MSGWVDAHTHLDMAVFDADRDAVVARARQAGVEGFVLAGADPDRWDAVQQVGEDLGAAWVLGLHPWWEADLDAVARDARLQALADRPTPHGIGETGLDFLRARDDDARARQVETTRAHVALARERDVPVVFHCVRAYPQLLRLLEADGLPAAGGMIHSWSGNAQHVRRAVRLGLAVSFGTNLAHARHAAEALRETPREHLLLETDCPDQPLERGGRGEPAHLVAVAEHAARLLGADPHELLDVAARNARRLFPVLGDVPS